MSEDIRSYNVGSSDYAKHKIQPWDIWLEYNLNPWEADIVKRILRRKEGQSRREDLEKIIHISHECIRQIDAGEYFTYNGNYMHNIKLCDILSEYKLNMLESDIVYFITQNKAGKSRRKDFEKIIYAANELIRQIDEK